MRAPCVAARGSGYGWPSSSSGSSCQLLSRSSRRSVSKPPGRCSYSGSRGGFCSSRRRGLSSSTDRVPTEERMAKMVRVQVRGTFGPRHRRPSVGFRSPTHNLRRRESADIARRAALRHLVGRLASPSASRYGFGRHGRGHPGVSAERELSADEVPRDRVGDRRAELRGYWGSSYGWLRPET